MLTVGIFAALFAASLWFFTGKAYICERAAGAYPFAMIIFGLVFLYLFVINNAEYPKYSAGALFLICGFFCMHDVKKLRRGRRDEDTEESGH